MQIWFFTLLVLICKLQHTSCHLHWPTLRYTLNESDIQQPMNNGTPHSKRFPEQSPVEVDCSQVAFQVFGDNITNATFKWYWWDLFIFDNSTMRGRAISHDGMTLLISTLTIASGAEGGTEGQYSCVFCVKRSCREASIELIAPSPPILECLDSTQPDISGDLAKLYVDIGCDLCIEHGQSVKLVKLTCAPRTNRWPTQCIIHNPDGISAQELVNGNSITTQRDAVVISDNLMRNPEDPDPPTLLGTWSCNCTNRDGNVTASSKISSCYVPPTIDKGVPQKLPLEIASGCMRSHTFKIGGSECVFPGNNFTMICNISEGNPEPEITWLKDGEALPQFTNFTHVTVPVSKDDPAAAAGEYTCKVTNKAGMDDAHTQMQLGTEILLPPTILKGNLGIRIPLTNESEVEVIISTHVHIATRGSMLTVIFNCTLIHQGFPKANITWTRNGVLINITDIHMTGANGTGDEGSLYIINITRSTKGGYYCCKAESYAGRDIACSELHIPKEYQDPRLPVEEDQHVKTAVTVSTTVIFVFILVIGLVGVSVLIKYYYHRKKHILRNKSHEMSRNLPLPSTAMYQGLEEVNTLAADDTDWEMSHEDLELLGSLGMGQFGDVKLALLKNTTCTDRVRSFIENMMGGGESLSTCKTVAVKFLRGAPTVDSESKMLFLQEINLMKRVSSVGSRHVIQLIGCIVSETPMAMVMEYAPFGDLHGNLIKWREELGTHSTYIKPLSGSISDLPSAILDKDQQYVQEALKEKDLFSFAHQIAIGMSYLASMNVIHRDLACRNILVGENKILKVSDFGLSKEVDGIYAAKSKTKLPLRWMSPEAITHRMFSEKSDIWSYGVCLWEICTLGAVPFGHKSNAEVAASVAESVLLERPRTCHDQIYKLMLECWKMNASDRPTFRDIENYFEDLIVNKYNHLYITIYDIPEAHDIEDTPNPDPVRQTEEA